MSAKDFGNFGLLFDENDILRKQHTLEQLKQFALPLLSRLWGLHSLSAPSVPVPPAPANLQTAKAGMGWALQGKSLTDMPETVHHEEQSSPLCTHWRGQTDGWSLVI